MRKAHIKLNESEYRSLTALTRSGETKARKYKRAMTLLRLHEGETISAVSKLLKYSYRLEAKVSGRGTGLPGRKNTQWASPSHRWNTTR